MASASSVPGIQFTPAGLVIPQELDILDGVQQDMNVAFGGGLNPALETPQGQLASSQTAIIGDKNNEIAYFVNQVDPQYSEGKFQDAIARIYFINRKPATSTSVVATLTGLPNTVIPEGTLAQDTNGYTYACMESATISIDGTVEVEFQNVSTGPIPCAEGTLTQVYQMVSGWDAITNSEDGTLGRDVESRADFEWRRKNSVALNAHGSAPSIYGAVFDVDNVLDCFVVDNPTGETVLYGVTDYPLLPHSVYVAVVGGLDSEIAQAIWTKKDVGCDYNGNTSVSVSDDSGYSYPRPTYTVKFERPDELPVKFVVEIVDNPSLPHDIEDQVKSAVISRFNGTDGTYRERMGSTIFASRYYSAVAAIDSSVAVIAITISASDPPSPGSNLVYVGIDQRPTLSASDIGVTLS